MEHMFRTSDLTKEKPKLLTIVNFVDGATETAIFNLNAHSNPGGKGYFTPSTSMHNKMESIMCHICNMYVPKQFLRKHNMSLKHKIYMKIADTALKRIKKHIQDENNNEKIKVNESIYFCSDCDSVVNIKEKENHEKSLNHINSVFLDKRLSDFLNLYSNNIEKADNDPNTVNEESNEILTSNEKSKQTKFEDAINDFDLISYLDILKDKYKMSMNVKVINKGWLEIEIDGKQVEVAANHFYGLKENSDTSSNVQCIVCPEIVKYEDIVSHMMKAEHMYRVSRPMQDIHCKRENYPFWHNCVLCNVLIANYDFHTTNDAIHKKRLKEALRSDAAKSVDNSTVSSQNVTSNKKSNQSDVTAIQFMNIDSKYNYIFKIESGRLWCMVCNVAVDETDSFETHINLDDHIKKYKELLSTNKLQLQYNNDFFCGVCNEVVVTKNELLHANDNSHKRNLHDSEKNISRTQAPGYFCHICNVKVPNNVNNIEAHNRGRSHLKKNAKILLKSDSFVYKCNIVS